MLVQSRLFIALCLTTLISVQTTFAEETEPKIVPKPDRARDTVYENSSEHNRMNKQWGFHAQLVGFGPTAGNGTGLSGSYFLSRNDILEASFITGKPIYWYGSYSSYDITSRSLSFYYKRFVTNSFYVKGGIGHHTVDYKYDSTWSLSTVHSKFKGSGNYAELLIGNQWQMENFTIGCDWVGYTAPINTEITDESITATDAYEYTWFKDDQDRLVKNGRAQAVRFYIGASF